MSSQGTRFPSKEKIVFEDVQLRLRAPSHRPWTLRDRFVTAAKNPASLFGEVEKHDVLRGVSLRARAGERIGVIGRNGSGKTSLCRVICGQLTPTAGSARVLAPATGIFDTSIGIYPELTGRENAALLLHYLAPSQKSRHAEILRSASDFSGLGDWIDKPFRLYSTGMKTRLSLSLVTSLETDVLVLDEVFDGADEEFKERMQVRMREFIARASLFFFVSHAREQIRAVCDRVLVVEAGLIAHDGSPEEAFRVYDKILGAARGTTP